MKITECFLEKNEFSRPGKTRPITLGIVLHNVGVPEQNAETVRNYFNSLRYQTARDNTPDRSASAHYVIDQSGDILYIIPQEEKAYHVGSSQIDPESGKIYTRLAREAFGDYAKYPDKTSPNSCTIGIEMCNRLNGVFTEATIIATAELCAMLCNKFGFDPLKKIFTHHEIVGWKNCPEYWTKHPTLFAAFKLDVKSKMEK
jgi:N-acetylmuramoyl-L-alanine amidase